MSKTYYKYPSLKDYGRHHTRWAKRQASKAARKDWEIGNGCNYRKCYCRYDIFDYRYTYFRDIDALKSFYAEDDQLYKIRKKSLLKYFRKDSIRYKMEVDH